jgi:hypothetical protein
MLTRAEYTPLFALIKFNPCGCPISDLITLMLALAKTPRIEENVKNVNE